MNADRLIQLDGVLTRVIQDGPPDAYNNPTETTETAAVKCWYELERADESTVDANLQGQTHKLYFRAGAAVTGFDSLAVDGHVFQILGPPWDAKNPRTQQPSHVEAKGRQTA